MFRKTFLTILCLFVLSAPAYATDYFLDLSHDQANGGDGTTMQTDGGADDAFKTFAEAYASIGTTDTLWIRRITNVTQGANIVPTQDGTAAAPAYWIGWPRDALTITSATWTNGSTTVDLILPASMSRSANCGRWVTAPDSHDYLITLVTDANTFTIDRPYAGGSVSGGAGESTIKADELPQGVSEPADTDSWSADGDDLALIDFDDGDFNVVLQGPDYNQFWNLEFKDSTDGFGLIYINSTGEYFNGCLFLQSTQNDYLFKTSASAVFFNRCIFEGFGGANGNVELSFDYATIVIKNSAVYNMGDYGITTNNGTLILENVNLGVEVANSNEDVYIQNIVGKFRDVKFGGTNGEIEHRNSYSGSISTAISTNHNKVLGAWKQYHWVGGTSEKVAVTGTAANKKLSDNVIEITPETTATYQSKEIELKIKVFESRKSYDAGTYNVKIWIYNDTGNTLNDTTFSDDILMRCRAEAGNYGDATTEYVSMPWTYSDEIDIADAANADDWDYLQCDSVVVDVSGSHIYCEVLSSFYDAGADVVLIDPVTTNP